jgi:hypothetical protein
MKLSEKLMTIIYCSWMALPAIAMVVIIDLLSD